MRRVVVTGLGAVTPLGSDIQVTWERLLEAESGAGPIEGFEVADLPARIACQVPTGNRHGAFNPDDWLAAQGAAQGRPLHRLRYRRRRAGAGRRRLGGADRNRSDPHRRSPGIGHRRAAGDRECLDPGPGARSAAVEPVLHPGGADQPDVGSRLDPQQPARPQPRGGDRLRDRRARHWRRRPPDHARRRRRHGRGRRRGGGLPPGHRRVRRDAGAVDAFQRHARSGRRGPGTATATAS